MNYPARPSSQQLRYTTDSLHDSGKLRPWKGGAAEYQSVIFNRRRRDLNRACEIHITLSEFAFRFAGRKCYTAELRGETKFVGDEII